MLQQTYEELGYPGEYFNDRLVAVIDHLLQTPQPQEPLGVHMAGAGARSGSAADPWLRYELAESRFKARFCRAKDLVALR